MSASPHNATLECLCPDFPWLHRWSRPSSSLCQPIYSNPSLRPCEISAEFTATKKNERAGEWGECCETLSFGPYTLNSL